MNSIHSSVLYSVNWKLCCNRWIAVISWSNKNSCHIIFSFEYALYDKHSNYTVTHLLFIIRFKIYLCSIGRVRNASDADISFIFRISFLFVYCRSELDGSFSNGTKNWACESRCCLRDVPRHEIWHWATRLETFTEMICWTTMWVLGRSRLTVVSF